MAGPLYRAVALVEPLGLAVGGEGDAHAAESCALAKLGGHNGELNVAAKIGGHAGELEAARRHVRELEANHHLAGMMDRLEEEEAAFEREQARRGGSGAKLGVGVLGLDLAISGPAVPGASAWAWA